MGWSAIKEEEDIQITSESTDDKQLTFADIHLIVVLYVMT
jgi:hypothetical protein